MRSTAVDAETLEPGRLLTPGDGLDRSRRGVFPRILMLRSLARIPQPFGQVELRDDAWLSVESWPRTTVEALACLSFGLTPVV